MARTHNEDNSAFNQHFQSGRFSHSRRVLEDDVVLTVNGSLVNFFDANGSDRNVTLPSLEEGRFYVVGNVGASDDLNVRDVGGTLVTSLLPSDTALMFASDNEWMALRGWAALGVFTNSVNGLVPAPNSGVPGSLFLRDDGQWAQVQVVGIVDAFKYITDGVNTAEGSGPDTFWLRSSSQQIDIVVTNGEVTFGDNANFSINEAFVDHDALLNYVGDEHVAHSGVTLTAGVGLTGGGDISASRSFDFTPSGLAVNAAPVLTDYAVMDLAAGTPMVTLWSSVNAIFDHNALVNYVADQHVAHSGVSIVTAAGSGLQGGGDITASRTLSLDFNALTLDAVPAVSDMLAFYDVSEGVHNKFTITDLNAVLDHDALINFFLDEHVPHSGVTLTAGAGLTGGGNIAASRTFTVGAGTGITVNADDVALDTTHVRNIDHSTVSITPSEGIQGGGDISANRTLKLDINGLTADATPDPAADYLVTYDTSTGLHKKVLMEDLPSGGGAVIYTGAQTLTDTQKAQARANIDALKKNYILNGAMMVSQENGSTAGTTNLYYPVDQWNIAFSQGGALSVAQVASPTPGGSPNRVRVTVTTADASVAAGDFIQFRQVIEGLRCADLRFGSSSAKTVTIQFGIKAPAGTYGVSIRNSAVDRSYFGEVTITGGEANTDVVKSVTIAGDQSGTWLTTNGIGMYITFALMAGSTFHQTPNTWLAANAFASSSQFNFMGTIGNVFELFDVSLTEGTDAPAFQMPDYAVELTKCQRYLYRLGADQWFGSGMLRSGGTNGYHKIDLPVPMRASPTYTSNSVSVYSGDTNTVPSIFTVGGWSANSLLLNGSSTMTTIGALGDACMLLTGGSGWAMFNARL